MVGLRNGMHLRCYPSHRFAAGPSPFTEPRTATPSGAHPFSGAPDGRHTMIAWMSNWDYANNVPTRQFRSANTIARDPFLYTAEGKYYLGSRPAPEYAGAGLDKVLKVNGSCKVTLSNAEGEEFVIAYDQRGKTLSCDRSRSGLTDFSERFNEIATAPVHRKLTSLRIFVDNCSVEFSAMMARYALHPSCSLRPL